MAVLSTFGFELDFMTGLIGMFCPLFAPATALPWLFATELLVAVLLCKGVLLFATSVPVSPAEEPSSSSSLDEELETKQTKLKFRTK